MPTVPLSKYEISPALLALRFGTSRYVKLTCATLTFVVKMLSSKHVNTLERGWISIVGLSAEEKDLWTSTIDRVMANKMTTQCRAFLELPIDAVWLSLKGFASI